MLDCTPGTEIRGANVPEKESECVVNVRGWWMFMTVLSAKDPLVRCAPPCLLNEQKAAFQFFFLTNINN